MDVAHIGMCLEWIQTIRIYMNKPALALGEDCYHIQKLKSFIVSTLRIGTYRT